jgi:hypothetical protein
MKESFIYLFIQIPKNSLSISTSVYQNMYPILFIKVTWWKYMFVYK